MTEKGLTLEVTPEAKEFLIDKGYDLEFGARPLRRAIERYVEDPLSENILRGEFKGKNQVTVSLKDGHLVFEGSSRPVKKTDEGQDEVAEVSQTT